MNKNERPSDLPKYLKDRKPVKKPKKGVYYWMVAPLIDQPRLIKMGSIDVDRESPGCFNFSYPNNVEVDVADKNIVVGLSYICALGNLNHVRIFMATEEEVAQMKAQYFLRGLEDATRQIRSSCQ